MKQGREVRQEGMFQAIRQPAARRAASGCNRQGHGQKKGVDRAL